MYESNMSRKYSTYSNQNNNSLTGSSQLSKNTHKTKLNPLAFSALKSLDIENFEDNLAKELQKTKMLEEREKVI